MLTIKRLELKEARFLIESARLKAESIAVDVCIAVTDESGHLIAFERMNDSKITSVILAIDKGFTATGIKKGTHELGVANQPGSPVHGIASTLGGRMVVIGGGLPVVLNGDVVGGIGVSGGSPDQDIAIAEAALAALS